MAVVDALHASGKESRQYKTLCDIKTLSFAT